MARIACVLVDYRNPEDTAGCLRSLGAAGLEGFKIFLVDNDPGGGAEAPLRAALAGTGAPHAYFAPPANLGFAGGVNLGARAALAEGFTHVLVLNNDTVVEPGFTEALRRAVDRYPSEVLAGRVLERDTGAPTWNIGTFSPWTSRIRHIFDAGYAGPVEFVSGCLLVAPAAALRTVGLLDERYFMYSEDMDFCLRLKAAGIGVRYVPGMDVRHRTSSSASASRIPKEYYVVRNEIAVVLGRARTAQKLAFLAQLPAMLAWKLVRRPRLFPQALRGAIDGLRGRLGRMG